jgi:hypothetical protein
MINLKQIAEKVAAPVARIAKTAADELPPVSRDPFMNDAARKAEINAASERGRGRWLPSTRGWLSRRPTPR